MFFVQWSFINGNERNRTNIIESPAPFKVLSSVLLMAGIWSFLEHVYELRHLSGIKRVEYVDPAGM